MYLDLTHFAELKATLALVLIKKCKLILYELKVKMLLLSNRLPHCLISYSVPMMLQIEIS